MFGYRTVITWNACRLTGSRCRRLRFLHNIATASECKSPKEHMKSMHTYNKKTHFKFAEWSGVIEEQHEIVVTTLGGWRPRSVLVALVVYCLNKCVSKSRLFYCLFRGRKIYKMRRYISLPHHIDYIPSYTTYPSSTTNFCNGTTTGR